MASLRPLLLLLAAAAIIALALGFFLAPGDEVSIQLDAPAVTSTGAGTLAHFTLSARPGQGRILLDASHAQFDTTTQDAFRNARAAAANYLHHDFGGTDFILASDSAPAVEGESAGALLAVGIVSLASGESIRSDAAVSAAIEADGRLNPVGGLDEKLAAAAQAGKRVFVIAAKQDLKHEPDLVQLYNVSIVRAATLADAETALEK